MSKIPTAEEILIKERILLKTIEESGNFPLNLTRDTHIGTAKNIKNAMIAFAKLHVEAALKEAAKKAEIHSDSGSNYHREFEEGIRNRIIWIPENSILNAYFLENIK